MKKIVLPKCPYCHTEFNDTGFSSPLQSLYGEYSLETTDIKCSKCGETYYVSRQTVFRSRKKI